MDSRLKGYLAGALAAAAYGCNPLFGIPMYHDGMEPLSVLFLRFLGAAAILGIVMRWKRMPFHLERNQLVPVMVMGILMLLSSITLFHSYLYMDAGIASSLLFVYPVMVAVLNVTLFHEKVTSTMVVSLVLALAGICLLYRPAGTDQTTQGRFLVGFLLVMGSALSYAIYMIGVNRPSVKQIPSVTLVFYVLLIGAFLYGIFLLLKGRMALPQSPLGWTCAGGIALVPTIVAFFGTAWGIRLAGSTPVAILGALEPVTAVFFGILLFGEQLTFRASFGIILIILAVTLIILGKKNSHS
ncbi:MAG: EamA family transporter [Victivallales bacterium]|nr:EamA family transporter [Victivallales bacterium]